MSVEHAQIPRPGSPAILLDVLRSKPRNQARVKITRQLAQRLQSEPDILAPLRTVRTMQGGHEQADPCQLVWDNNGDPAVEYIIYDAGYETPDDTCADP